MIKRLAKESLPDSIIRQILDLIRSGKLTAGDRVPPEHQLVTLLGVGRTSVREALKALQVLGVIERRTNGTFVTEELPELVLSQLLTADFVSRALDVLHLYQARRVLEVEITTIAAASIDAEQLSELEELCRKMESLSGDGFHEFFALDMEFHLGICHAAHNPVLTRMWSVVQELLEPHRTRISKINNIVEMSNANHRRILAALSARDTVGARQSVREALEEAEKLITRSLKEEDE